MFLNNKKIEKLQEQIETLKSKIGTHQERIDGLYRLEDDSFKIFRALMDYLSLEIIETQTIASSKIIVQPKKKEG